MQLSAIANATACILKRNAVHMPKQSGAFAHTMPKYPDGTEHEIMSENWNFVSKTAETINSVFLPLYNNL